MSSQRAMRARKTRRPPRRDPSAAPIAHLDAARPHGAAKRDPRPARLQVARTALQRLRAFLTIDEPTVSPRLLATAAALAFVAGVLARYGVHARSEAELLLGPDGHRVLTSADGYYYATGIKAAVQGVLADYERVPTPASSALVAIGAAIAMLTRVHISELSYYFPIFASPIVIAAVLAWGFALRSPRTALLAMLPVSLGFAYLMRTGPGQFDTDFLALTAPYLALAAAMGSLTRQRPWLATVAGLCFAGSSYLHPGSERVLSLCSLVVMVYVLVARRDRDGARLLCALGAGLLPLPVPARFAAVAVVHIGLTRTALGLRTLLATGVGLFIAAQVALQLSYLDPLVFQGAEGAGGLTFYDVRPEVAELRPIALSALAERVCGGWLALALAGIGLVGLTIVHPVTLVLWPLFVLGTAYAHLRGERFTIYAVPVSALGLAWLAGRALALAEQHRPKLRTPATQLVASVVTALVLAVPAASHARKPHVVSTYPPGSLDAMTTLAKVAKEGDYALAPWDESYGLWYYAGVRTLVDGAKQDADLFVIAEVLYGDSQMLAAGLSRLAVARQRAGHSDQSVIRDIFADARRRGQTPDEVLRALSDGTYPLPPRQGEIYLCLSSRLASLGFGPARARKVEGLPSHDDIAVGHLDVATPSGPLRGRIPTWNGGILDADSWRLGYPGWRPAEIAQTMEVSGWHHGKLDTRTIPHHRRGSIHVLHFVSADALLLVDDVMLRSSYIRLGVFHAFDPRAFLPVQYRRDSQVFRVHQ